MTRGDVRSRLIDVGARRIMERGFNSTGINDIVGAANVPKGSFYYYFDSKEDFACAVIDHYSDLNAARRRALLVANPAIPPLQRLRNYLEAYAKTLAGSGYVGGCLLGNLSTEVADHSKAVRRRLRAAFASWQAMLRSVLAEASQRGELPTGLDLDAIAAYFVNGWEGALVRMKTEKSAAPLRLFIRTTFDHLLAAERSTAGQPRRRAVTRRNRTG
jgi:TetR/AcrR family transcriptional repressor of nem operon